MDYDDVRFNEAREITNKLSDYLNNYHYEENAKFFCDAMSREHRTLQQNFTRLMFAWLEYVASDAYRFDARNEASHKQAKQMLEAWLSYQEGVYGHELDARPSKWLPTI